MSIRKDGRMRPDPTHPEKVAEVQAPELHEEEVRVEEIDESRAPDALA